jgi:hypothetical protein
MANGAKAKSKINQKPPQSKRGLLEVINLLYMTQTNKA